MEASEEVSCAPAPIGQLDRQAHALQPPDRSGPSERAERSATQDAARQRRVVEQLLERHRSRSLEVHSEAVGRHFVVEVDAGPIGRPLGGHPAPVDVLEPTCPAKLISQSCDLRDRPDRGSVEEQVVQLIGSTKPRRDLVEHLGHRRRFKGGETIRLVEEGCGPASLRHCA